MYKKANKSAGNCRDEEKLKTAAMVEPNEGERKEGRTGRDRAKTQKGILQKPSIMTLIWLPISSVVVRVCPLHRLVASLD